VNNRKAAIQKLKNLVLTPKGEVETYRRKVEETFGTVFLPNHVEVSERDYGGVKCDVLVPEVYSSRRVLIYIHGGSFVAGSRDSWRGFCASLAHAASCRVVVPEFRLAPTHPFPAGIEDIQNVFRLVYSEEEIALQLEKKEAEISRKGVVQEETSQIIIAADGSGASLAIAVMLNMNEKFKKCIKNLILFSPWLDLSSSNELIAVKKVRDEVIGGEDLHRAVDLYTYAANISNPLVSPLRGDRENFKDFPPVYIQMGEKEILVKQAQAFARILKDVGVECTLDLWPDMIYMFQRADEYLADSHLAVEKIGKYISSREGLTEEEKEELKIQLKKNDIFYD